MTNLEIVETYLDAVERFDVEAVEPLLHEVVMFEELPNRIRPKGGKDDREAMLAGMRRAAERKVLSAQRYILGDISEAADRIFIEGRWEGTLAMPIGRLGVGDTMVAHLCMIFAVKDGKIFWQRNYDCYEDFSAN
jgi:ketosteroid isomerase-like protein